MEKTHKFRSRSESAATLLQQSPEEQGGEVATLANLPTASMSVRRRADYRVSGLCWRMVHQLVVVDDMSAPSSDDRCLAAGLWGCRSRLLDFSGLRILGHTAGLPWG